MAQGKKFVKVPLRREKEASKTLKRTEHQTRTEWKMATQKKGRNEMDPSSEQALAEKAKWMHPSSANYSKDNH